MSTEAAVAGLEHSALAVRTSHESRSERVAMGVGDRLLFDGLAPSAPLKLTRVVGCRRSR
jgi:hypothetical protein